MNRLVAGFQMYGRYTQELGVYAKEEAARLREGGQRRSVSDRSRTLDLLEYDKGRCAKCRSKFATCALQWHSEQRQVHYTTAVLNRLGQSIKKRETNVAFLK